MIVEKFEGRYTKYEIARILGARSLQIAMDAPILLKLTPEEENELNYDSLKIAEKEFMSEVLPITVKRPLPKKSEKVVKKLSEEEIKKRLEKKAELEAKEKSQKTTKTEIGEDGEEKAVQEDNDSEMMEIANPSDEEDISDDSDDSEEF
jgi:DNA-directed RNA polymerase subunit K